MHLWGEWLRKPDGHVAQLLNLEHSETYPETELAQWALTHEFARMIGTWNATRDREAAIISVFTNDRAIICISRMNGARSARENVVQSFAFSKSSAPGVTGSTGGWQSFVLLQLIARSLAFHE